MKKIFAVLVVLLWASRLPAQTNPPVRLAIVPETPEAVVAADVLTAEFSPSSKVQLLERADIERVYREQGLSAANRDDLKLGQLLGADGLLLVESVQEETNSTPNIPFAVEMPRTFNVRLVAVKAGVVLAAGRFSVATKDLPEWASSYARHLDLFLPKLAVLARDAVPISVVNLRSAIASAEASETERQLKTLTIQRLSQEPRLFVLERQRMQSLGEEKELKPDESAFWNGSYLLEGVVDQNGYSQDSITINGWLTPPKGGESVQFVASGSRTNLAEVINQLAAKVIAALQINPTAKEWSSSDEAAQFFQEAQWASRWGVFKEAQAAAESAWALGKRDLACALVRGTAYLRELQATTVRYQNSQSTLSPGYDVNGKPNGPAPSDARVKQEIKRLSTEHPLMVVFNISESGFERTIHYAFADRLPAVENIDRAQHVLELYNEFCRLSPDGEPKVMESWNAAHNHNSDWYQLGIDDLVAASKVLQSFNLAPANQQPVADKLAELRTLARSTAQRISAAPSVHGSLFVGGRIATRDELVHTMEEAPNIFKCEVNWGCFWQERPEDTIALYRELMSSAVFCYIHGSFWNRDLLQPRLVAWNQADQQRCPRVWADFVRELNSSTNVLLRMEAKALEAADAQSNEEAESAKQEWWSLVRSNREELVANNVELFYLGWKFAATTETEAMDQEYWHKTVPAGQQAADFEKQKQYLAGFTPYDWNDFNKTFESRDYTKAQAGELQPLVAAYKSNLLTKLPANVSPLEKLKAKDNVQWVEFYLEQHVKAALNSQTPAPRPAVSPPPQNAAQPRPNSPAVSQSVLMANHAASLSPSNSTPEIVTNVLLVDKFLPIPLAGLPGDHPSHVAITAHHWQEGKLVLDFQYGSWVYSSDKKGDWQSSRSASFPAVAILDPATGQWQAIGCPEVDITRRNRFYHHTTLCRGELFTSNGGQVRKYDSVGKSWQVLDISGIDNCELFTVNGQLYAATSDMIMEILDGGKRTHILASNRRQPPASLLDTENLGTPLLFAGPDHSLRAAVEERIVTWDGKDWRTICPAPQTPTPPVISDDSLMFFADGSSAPAGLWRLASGSSRVEFCLKQNVRQVFKLTGSDADADSQPVWKLPPGFSLPKLAAASCGSDLYLLADHAKSENIVNEQQHLVVGKRILPQNGYHAELLCFAANLPVPLKIFLKFDGDDTSLPVSGDSRPAGPMLLNRPSHWLLLSTNNLICGREVPGAFPSNARDPRFHEPQTGIWMIPLASIDAEIARQEAAQRQQMAQTEALAKQTAQLLFEKYDRNHNGVLDENEREEALDDPAYIKTQLDAIDANHNGWLDLDELVWFDANHNKTLDPKESAGIQLALQFLAENLLDQFDQSGNGRLTMPEYENMVRNTLRAYVNSQFDFLFQRADANHDNHLDREELKNLLGLYLETELKARVMPGVVFGGAMGIPGQRSVEFEPALKQDVEAYWRHPDGLPNHPFIPMRLPTVPANRAQNNSVPR